MPPAPLVSAATKRDMTALTARSGGGGSTHRTACRVPFGYARKGTAFVHDGDDLGEYAPAALKRPGSRSERLHDHEPAHTGVIVEDPEQRDQCGPDLHSQFKRRQWGQMECLHPSHPPRALLNRRRT